MDTILSYNGYSISKKNKAIDFEKIKSDLTFTPIDIMKTNQIKFITYEETENRIYMPKNYGLENFGVPEKNKLSKGIDCPNLVFTGELREQQKIIVEKFIEDAINPLKMGGIISAKCGEGKTIMAIYISCHFKKKTLFIIHKDFLGNQAKEALLKFCPNVKIGIIKQSKIDIEDKDFVIASLQSLSKRDYDKEIFKQFGLVIIDECHHTGAEIFSRALKKISCYITLGLSATLDRKDGMRKVFEYYLGKQVLKTKKNNKPMLVKIYKYYDTDIEYSKVNLLYNGKPNISKMVNNITSYIPRTVMIIKIIKSLLKKEKDRKILILSERRNHLLDFELIIKENNIASSSVGYYVGGMNQEELKLSETKQIILGTYQMASEGMDIPSLNTLILASPYTSIEQSIGRIQRQKENEITYIPLTIDIWDNFSTFNIKGYSRIKYYKNHNYEIEYYNNDMVKIELEKKEDKKYSFIKED